MGNMAEAYADQIHENFPILYANWPPGNELKLGDYGIMQGNLFVRMGNIDEKDVRFTARDGVSLVDQEYTSGNSVAVKFIAKGSGTVGGGPTANASVDINFSSQNATFFYAAGCSVNSIEQKDSVGDQILSLVKRQQWDTNYVVVTDIVNAGKTTIIISGGTQASVNLQASSSAAVNINFGDINASLSLTQQDSIGFKAVTANGMQPLFGLCKVQPVFLWVGHRWQPFSVMMLAAANTKAGAGGQPPPVYFGQLK